jgi:hypothetical protein
MATYQVHANGTVFGLYDGATEQAARDLCAVDAGYKSEDDMVAQLGQASELVAVDISNASATPAEIAAAA